MTRFGKRLATLLPFITMVWALISLRTVFFEDSVAFGIDPFSANVNIVSGRGTIVVWAWHPFQLYPRLLWQTGFTPDGPTSAERVTGHSGWIWSLIPLAGERRGSITVTIPSGLVLVLLAIPTAVQFRRNHQSRRQRLLAAGRCLKCEYDLRASTGRCPECGSVISTSTAKPSLDQGKSPHERAAEESTPAPSE